MVAAVHPVGDLLREWRQRRRMSQLDWGSGLDRLSRLTQPTLILWGGRDRLIPPEHGERFALIAGKMLALPGRSQVVPACETQLVCCMLTGVFHIFRTRHHSLAVRREWRIRCA